MPLDVRHNIGCRRTEFWYYMSCYGIYVGGTKGDIMEGSTWFVKGSMMGKLRDKEIKRSGCMYVGSFLYNLEISCTRSLQSVLSSH